MLSYPLAKVRTQPQKGIVMLIMAPNLVWIKVLGLAKERKRKESLMRMNPYKNNKMDKVYSLLLLDSKILGFPRNAWAGTVDGTGHSDHG